MRKAIFTVFLIFLIVFLSFPFTPELKEAHAQGQRIARIDPDWSAWLQGLTNWSLEWLNGSVWQPSSDLTVTYVPLNLTSGKFSLDFTASQTARYRLNVTISNVRNGTSLANAYSLEFFDGDAVFDWSDTLGMAGFSRAVALNGALAEQKNLSWSIVSPIIPAGTEITVDPSITRVQGNARGTSSYSTTVAATLTGTPVSGNIIIAAISIISYGSGTTVVNSIAQTNVDWTYQIRLDREVRAGYNLYATTEVWLGVVSASAGKTATATMNSSSVDRAVINLCEYSGIATSSYLDKTATNYLDYPGSTSSDTGTTGTTSQGDELWIGSICVRDLTATQSSPTHDFTLLDGAAYGAAYLEKIVSVAGTANSGTTISATQPWVGCIATFKGAEVPAEDYVDSQSDVDSTADVGTHSSFDNEKAKDSTYDTLTEASVGESTSDVFTDGFEDNTFDKWTDGGATTWQIGTNTTLGSPWLTHSGTYMAYCDSTHDGNLTSDNIDASGKSQIGLSFWYMDDDVDTADNWFLYYYDGTGYDYIADLNAVASEDVWYRYSATITDEQYLISTFQIRFAATSPDSGEVCFIDDVTINTTTPGVYQLQLEEQFTGANYTRANEELCIYMGTYGGSEALNVEWWNTTSSSWLEIISGLTASSWNNVSVTSYLTASTFTIRFHDDSTESDVVQDTWQKDACLLHTWEAAGPQTYILDLTLSVTNGLTSALQVTYKIALTLQETATIETALATTYKIVSALTTSQTLDMILTATYKIVPMLEVTSTLDTALKSTYKIASALGVSTGLVMEVLNWTAGVTYILDLALTVSTALTNALRTTYNIASPLTVTSTLNTLLKTTFTNVLSLTVTTALTTIPNAIFNIAIALTSSIGLIADVQKWVGELKILTIELPVTIGLSILQAISSAFDLILALAALAFVLAIAAIAIAITKKD